jgi:cell volume regulation protein A
VPGEAAAGGDARAPYKREVERFHAALASLAEIVAFVVLGLTISLDVVSRADVWVPGLVLGAALAFVIRPALVGLCLVPARLERGERAFVLFAGLKGAVPVLLGSFLLAAGWPGAQRLYGIVAVAVMFSVVVQGGLVPVAARLLRVPMRPVEPEPWALGCGCGKSPPGCTSSRSRPVRPPMAAPSASWRACPARHGSASSSATASSCPSWPAPGYGRQTTSWSWQTRTCTES